MAPEPEAPYSLRDEDWIKTLSWQWPYGNGVVQTFDELLESLGVENQTDVEQEAALREFMKLPAAEPMPAGIRAEVVELIGPGPY